MSARPQFRHVPELDGIRAIAVALVIASHAGLYGKVPGGFGVTIFFFLSGYLITSLLRMEVNKTGHVDFRAFYLRRVLRIMPPLYITLVILTALAPLGVFGKSVNWSAVPWDYLFLSNYSPLWGETGGLPSPLWSLAIEEHFYLLFPAIFLVLISRLSERQVGAAFVAGCLLILLLRFATVLLFPTLTPQNYIWTHTRLDSILFGCILAIYQNPVLDEDAWRPRRWHAVLALLLVAATFSTGTEVFRQTLRYSVQGAGLFVLFSFVLSAGSPTVNRILRSRTLVWIGLLSYTLYLCHMAIFEVVRTAFDVSRLVAGIVGLPIAIVFAQLMRSFVEVPILSWRRRHGRSVNEIAPDAVGLSHVPSRLGTGPVRQIVRWSCRRTDA
jgi:peptidoglycan/LPS O-acetylase OafA/YrhL